jgi:hypothetical protein
MPWIHDGMFRMDGARLEKIATWLAFVPLRSFAFLLLGIHEQLSIMSHAMLPMHVLIICCI